MRVSPGGAGVGYCAPGSASSGAAGCRLGSGCIDGCIGGGCIEGSEPIGSEPIGSEPIGIEPIAAAGPRSPLQFLGSVHLRQGLRVAASRPPPSPRRGPPSSSWCTTASKSASGASAAQAQALRRLVMIVGHPRFAPAPKPSSASAPAA